MKKIQLGLHENIFRFQISVERHFAEKLLKLLCTYERLKKSGTTFICFRVELIHRSARISYFSKLFYYLTICFCLPVKIISSCSTCSSLALVTCKNFVWYIICSAFDSSTESPSSCSSTSSLTSLLSTHTFIDMVLRLSPLWILRNPS